MSLKDKLERLRWKRNGRDDENSKVLPKAEDLLASVDQLVNERIEEETDELKYLLNDDLRQAASYNKTNYSFYFDGCGSAGSRAKLIADLVDAGYEVINNFDQYGCIDISWEKK